MQLLEEQRKRDLEQRESDRQWQEDRRKEDLDWREKQERQAEDRWNREHKLQRRDLLWVGMFGTLVLATVQILGALIQSGHLFPIQKEPPVINIQPPVINIQPPAINIHVPAELPQKVK